MDWETEEKLPFTLDETLRFQVWTGEGVRTVRRVGKSVSMWPGTLVYTDCTHPIQNVLCSESDVKGWRLTAAGVF